MIAAQQVPPLAIVLGVAACVGLVIFALLLFRGYEHLARRSLERRYAGLSIHAIPRTGDVVLTYHTYHGFIAWFTQTPHHVVLPPDDARILLGRLLRFNLTWGLVTCGVVFVLPLAVLNYLGQRRSVCEQEASGSFPASETTSPVDAPDHETDESASAFHRVVGWIAAGLCAVFAVSVVACLFTGEFEGAVGGAIASVVLGATARSWLVKRERQDAPGRHRIRR